MEARTPQLSLPHTATPRREAWAHLCGRKGCREAPRRRPSPIVVVITASKQAPMFRNQKEYEKIEYEIDSYSSYASNYKPENIMVENSGDPSSRWSTSATSLDQYIVLRLRSPAVLTTISFGKYCKIHVCNVKELKVYSEGFEILRCSLRNDTEKETYNLEYTTGNTYLISTKVKICPMSSWGMNFNYSLWYVELRGYSNIDSFVSFNMRYSDLEASRLALKFICKRTRDNPELNESFSRYFGVEVDHQVIKNIKELVTSRNYDMLERYLEELGAVGIFDEFMEEMPYMAIWSEVVRKDTWPSDRGGHQMVQMGGRLILYGGWDGEKELGDMWEFNVKSQEWKEIPYSYDDGPGRRSCHKMIAMGDTLYVFGRYIPMEYQRQSSWFEREIFYFKNNKWKSKRYLSGPSNLFDHQMVVAPGASQRDTSDAHDAGRAREAETCAEDAGCDTMAADSRHGHVHSTIDRGSAKTCCSDTKPEADDAEFGNPVFFLFGGRSQNDHYYAGLYKLEGSKMKVLRSQSLQPESSPELKGRVGHSLLYIPPDYFPPEDDAEHGMPPKLLFLSHYNNSLLIIGGQRIKDNYKEITFYSIDTDTVYRNIAFPIVSEGKVVQRAVLRHHEIVVHFSYSKEKDKFNETSLWIYNLKLNKWIECESNSGPSARSAHQFVECGSYYMYGGNLGQGSKRAGDMWKLELKKKTVGEIIRDLKFIVRKHRFLSMGSKLDALEYLKNNVYEVVDHRIESAKYKELCCSKLKNVVSTDECMIEEILRYFPSSMKAPERSLEELCK
ncbi:UNVERIFIED_CONTAM: hypothetical protein PYX00_011724 [Menopon gallinae]|uniref:Muskelin N-terminal domain-containing protein n=1 Tax=Menopon gallinae TaxID=328185 RepID=A0AAW2H8H4_9NEOP